MSFSVSVPVLDSFSHWRATARLAISHEIPPEEISWNGDTLLWGAQPLPVEFGETQISVPKAFLGIANSVIWHSDPARFTSLYMALWRLLKEDGHPLSNVDPLGAKLHQMAKSVRRDIHKMHAFVRFKELPTEQERRRFAAWFEPDHFITEPASSFFAKRFNDMDWMIATPSVCASFNGNTIEFSNFNGKPQEFKDNTEQLWGTYFSNIFNPARIKLDAMRSEMPTKYWKNMPETALIPAMLADAQTRVHKMQAAMPTMPSTGASRISERYRQSMTQPLETAKTIDEIAVNLQKCTRCHLCEIATRAVSGHGNSNARLMLVGEQPGDREDLEGRPFIGPAGELLREVLTDLGVSSSAVWITNAVKHFKFKVQGKYRIHESPNRSEIDHCRWWLEKEVEFIQPKVIIALGATASYALSGEATSQSKRRGSYQTLDNGALLYHTWHPSFALRTTNLSERLRIIAEMKSDLEAAIATRT